MTFRGDRKQLSRYMREIADLMGLRDWHVVLEDGPPTGGPPPEGYEYGGQCNVTYGRKFARISISDSWVDWSKHGVRYVIVHELVHCHFATVQEHHNHAEQYMDAGEWALFTNTFRSTMEHHIDAVAAAWAERLPLPEGKKKGK